MGYQLDGIYYTIAKNKYIAKWEHVYQKPRGIEKQKFTMTKVKAGREVR